MLSNKLTTARAEYYQAANRHAGAQHLYDHLLTQHALAGTAAEQAGLLLSTLRQEKKTAWSIYMRAVQEDTQARQLQVAAAQRAHFGVSMVISPPADYATA
ncbi:hypothetical protein [Hymenobacter glacieicola]|uniref:Uncharacterized protein n=1 Tax=Hymenobacter glacieicola TaxID=1562124 RepID=A0ABQ1WK85_9BACT|nr:hypothetical protein [Hymenobacter glacieicola]GGG33929.1 hypothetical protein GCM10011378_07950 [Hymenobacter glacieicola]